MWDQSFIIILLISYAASRLRRSPRGDFETYRIPPNPDDDALQGRLLIQVAASGRLEDHFRVVFGGGQHPSVTFSGQISNHPIFGPYNLLPPRMLIRRMWTLRKIHLFPNGLS